VRGLSLPLMADCRCGHPYAAHVHLRVQTDCGECGAFSCERYRERYRRRRWWHR
jgi:hypothetical protein